MSFDTCEGLLEKIPPFDTFAQVIERKSFTLNTGQGMIIPAHCSSLVNANERFKMILTVTKSGYDA